MSDQILSAEEVLADRRAHICGGATCSVCRWLDSHESLRAEVAQLTEERDAMFQRLIDIVYSLPHGVVQKVAENLADIEAMRERS